MRRLYPSLKAAACVAVSAATLLACGVTQAVAAPVETAAAKNLTLPVQFIDYDNDNTLFEYDYDTPLSLYAPGVDYQNGAAKGLVADTLVNGVPRYSQAAVERAAQGMEKELLRYGTYHGATDDSKKTQLFKNLAAQLVNESQDTTRERDALTSRSIDSKGATTNPDALISSWNCGDGSVSLDIYCVAKKNANGADPSVVWQQNGDGVTGYSASSALTSGKFAVDSNTDYKFSVYASADGATSAMGVQILNGNNAIKTYETADATVERNQVDATAGGWVDFYFNSGNATDITIKLTPKTDGKTVKVAGPQLFAKGTSSTSYTDIKYQNMLGSGTSAGDTSFNEGKTSGDANTHFSPWVAQGATDTVKGAAIANGTVQWAQDDNSAISYKGAGELTRTYSNLTAGVRYNMSYVRGWNGYGLAGIKVTDSTGNVIDKAAVDSNGTGTPANDAGSFTFTAPEDGKVTISLVPGSDSANKQYRAGDIKLVSFNELKDEKDNTYEAAQQYVDLDKKIDLSKTSADGIGYFRTPMDYCYYMLNNLYTGNVGTKYNGLDKLVFSGSSQDKDGAWFVADHTLRGKVTYGNGVATYTPYASDTDSSNVADRVNDGSVGFFPLDNASSATGKLTATIPLSTADNKAITGADGQQVQVTGTHNYHYTMKSGGTFVYKKAKNQFFNFAGDDDVYLFLNNKLAIDLGGGHQRIANGKYLLNDHAQELGLKDGYTYRFDFFYMERHTVDANFSANANLDVTPDPVGGYTFDITNRSVGFDTSNDKYEYTVAPADEATAEKFDVDQDGQKFIAPASQSGKQAVVATIGGGAEFTKDDIGKTYVFNIQQSKSEAGRVNDTAMRLVKLTVAQYSDQQHLQITAVITNANGKTIKSFKAFVLPASKDEDMSAFDNEPTTVDFMNTTKSPDTPGQSGTNKNGDDEHAAKLSATGASIAVAVVALAVLAGLGVALFGASRHRGHHQA